MPKEIAFLGDLHIGARNGSDVFRDYFKRTLAKMFDEMEARGITEIFQSGDFFDTRRGVTTKDIVLIYKWLVPQLRTRGMRMNVIVGNHDIALRESNEITSLTLLEPYSDVFYVYRETQRSIFSDYHDLKICICPWINEENKERTLDYLDKCAENDYDIVLGHFELQGFDMYRGVPSVCGMNIKPLKKFKKVISGHFHTASKSGNIQYLGTPWHLTWADYGDERGWYSMDTTTTALTLHKNEESLFKVATYDKGLDCELADLKNKIVRIDVVEKESDKKYANFLKALNDIEVVDLSINDTTVLDKQTDIELEDKNFEGINTLDAIVAYTKENSEKPDEVNEYMVDLHNRSQEVI